MVSRLRSWWQKTRKPLVVVGTIAAFVGVITLIIAGYGFRWTWTGFLNKGLWEWLQLLIVPAVLAIAGFWLNQIQKSREEKTTEQRAENERKAAEQRAEIDREVALDNQREAALQGYLDKMSELLLEKRLRESDPDAEVRKIARLHTLTVLPRLDQERKRSVLQSLYEAGLIVKDKSIVDLQGADLGEANLREADLRGANLWGANLSGANLRGANLWQADLSEVPLASSFLHGVPSHGGANLSGANLSGANLSGANLSGANLGGANLSGANLWGANLGGANLGEANLSGAFLLGANLGGANLREANLSDADLSGVNITNEQLATVKLFKGTIMPDGSKHP